MFRFKNFFSKKRDSFENMGECQQGDLEKLEFLFCPSFTEKKRMFFQKQTKVQKYIFLNVQTNQNMNVGGTIFEIFLKPRGTFRKTILGMLEEDFFDENSLFFRKIKIGRCIKEKRRNQKRRRKTEGVSQREMRERGNEKKETEKKHEGFPTTKGREKFFFFLKKVFGNKKRRATMRRVDKERERERENIRRVHTKEWKT